MLWLGLALLSALSWATADFLTKRWFSGLSAWEMAVLRLLWSLPFLWPLVAFAPPSPIKEGFWEAILGLLPVEVAATLLYMEAIRSSPLSLTLPFLSFTPLFLVLTGFLILGELPTLWGAGGIILVVMGGYVLNAGGGLLRPVRAVASERGSWMMLVAALLYAWTSAMGKLAIGRSDPFLFAPLYVTLLALALGLPLLMRGGGRRLLERPLKGLCVGATLAAMFASHYVAITMAEAAYVISVKRTSPLFGVLYGGLLLGEGHLGKRLGGTALMVAGVMTIGLLG